MLTDLSDLGVAMVEKVDELDERARLAQRLPCAGTNSCSCKMPTSSSSVGMMIKSSLLLYSPVTKNYRRSLKIEPAALPN